MKPHLKVTLRPSRIRHKAPERRDLQQERDIALRFEAALLSLRLALEIQAKCGLFPLPPDREAQLEGYRGLSFKKSANELKEELPGPELEMIQASFEELLEQTACTHCEMRMECAAVTAKLLQ